MANLVRRMFSSGSSLDSKRIVQSKEEHIQCNFNDWTIPEEHIETIYKVGTFDFKTAFSVKTHEETMNIQEKFQTISLLSQASLSKYAEKGFRYIHYGLIQVAVKPLVHIGVDAPIYLALRDKRLKRYKPSLLAMIQTNICNGPIYFYCAPNYSVSLTDPLIMNSLVLDIHMQGDVFEKLTEQFVVMYRVYYRLLSSQLNPRFKMIPTSRDETVLLHIEAEQSKTFTPKRLKWHEITIPDEFQIENPHPFPHIERNEISQIIEEPNGNVLIRFNSVREQESGSKIPIEPSRHSFAQSRRRSFAESSEQSFRMPNSIHVHHTAPIPEVSTSPPLSPTASQMKVDSLSSELKSSSRPNISRFPASYSSPHFQPSTLSKDQEAKLIRPSSSPIPTSSSPLLNKISQTLDKINSNLPSSSKINTIDQEDHDDSISSSHDSSLLSDNELIHQIRQVEDSFLEPHAIEHNNINKIRHHKFRQFSNPRWKTADTRNYYPRPTPPDIQYEERAKFHTAHYDGNSITNWNIDGKSEYEILNTLQEMGMAKIAYKVHNIPEQQAAMFLIAGFTGQLNIGGIIP
ncbi:hypothetical protein M9H77_24093 [Catharanthus roseus]|uniref:Uncharacterized protein n=1 Tax=Catharanthus roseus TaxID=4058 RepID=A0ACC0AWN8_CATRO|nr:hypothetical protein M9H77_24093 [Catharanthus roseus]